MKIARLDLTNYNLILSQAKKNEGRWSFTSNFEGGASLLERKKISMICGLEKSCVIASKRPGSSSDVWGGQNLTTMQKRGRARSPLSFLDAGVFTRAEKYHLLGPKKRRRQKREPCSTLQTIKKR